VIRQDLLLIPDDGFLVPQNLELISQQQVEPNLIVQELLLIPDDHRLVGDDFLLVLESGLRHCRSSSVGSIRYCVARAAKWPRPLRPCKVK
jgi:hypothetical protein